MKNLGLLLLLAAGCGPNLKPVPACVTNDECGEGLLCFAEGCGDPGKGIVVEVQGGALNGQFARDFALETGTLGATYSPQLGSPLSVHGEFQRERSASSNPLDRTSYTESVVLRAVGQSTLLPGIVRTYEERFASPERGSFEMKVGAGSFLVTAMPGDRTVPPVANSVMIEANNTATALTFVFPAVDGAPALTGQLIKKVDRTLLPPEPVLINSTLPDGGVATIDLQLFDVQSNQPLSQRFPVGSTTGEFAVTISPEARNRTSLILVASPREPGVPIPTKRFVVTAQTTAAISLEYGDFGEAADVEGTILDSTGTPVVGAQVVLEGTVVGDGTFRSRIVETGPTGDFKVSSLGSKADGSFQLTVAPPAGSRAAYSQRNVTVKVKHLVGAPSATATLDPQSLTLDDRLIARGSVTRPGTRDPAVGVSIRAMLQVETHTSDDLKALPIEPAEGVTADDGTFELPLDPGVWRFEYSPGESLPLSSRLVTIKATIDDQTGLKLPTQKLTAVELSFGRTVAGVVTGATLDQPVPYSQLRFFRVTTVEGRPASILLGTTIADSMGKYRVVLPTVAPAATDGGAASP